MDEHFGELLSTSLFKRCDVVNPSKLYRIETVNDCLETSDIVVYYSF